VNPPNPSLRAYQERFLAEVKGRLPLEGATILEVGSAEGALAHALAGAGAARVVGIDKAGPGEPTGSSSDRVRLIRMDAHQLQFADGEFDLAVSLATLEHVADPALVLAEIHRVLRPGGLLFARFAPIWTFATGHHYQVWLQDPEAHVPVWGHLYWDRKGLFDFLAERHGADAATRAVEYIYSSNEINRLPCRDYLRLFERVPFAHREVTPLVSEGFRPFLERTKGRLRGYDEGELLVAGFAVMMRK